MAAFRFLALLTVGFTLLALVFLLHVHQARLEREGTREILGPELALRAGESVTWTADLGGQRIEEAWPGEQRQPRLFVRGAANARIAAQARYLDPSGRATALGQAFIGLPPESTSGDGSDPAAAREGAPGEVPGTLEFGALWLSWELPLEITATVLSAGEREGTAQLVLQGQPAPNFTAARSVSRTLWAVFSVMAAAGFAGLVLTVRAGGSRPFGPAHRTTPG